MVKPLKKVKKKAYNTLDKTTKDQLISDAFEDLYAHRGRVYRANFVRGIFFGLGTFLGGTVIIALVIIILSWLMSIAPENFRDFIQWIINTLSKT